MTPKTSSNTPQENNRSEPCVVCGTLICSMVFANDPWCCDKCHKIVAANNDMKQSELTVAVFLEMEDVFYGPLIN